jgi:hypothetical protein
MCYDHKEVDCRNVDQRLWAFPGSHSQKNLCYDFSQAFSSNIYFLNHKIFISIIFYYPYYILAKDLSNNES